MLSTKAMMATIDEFHTFYQSLEQPRILCGHMGDKPLAVIEAGNLTKLSLRSSHIIAEESAHRIPYEQPQIIVDAIKKIISE